MNDRFGHPAGDEALRVVGRVLRDTVRELDVPARLGGEEFAVVLPNTNLDGAVRLAERIRVAIAEAAIVVGGSRIPLTVSLGVAAYANSDTVEDLMHQADRCLYAAKEAGKNVVVSGPKSRATVPDGVRSRCEDPVLDAAQSHAHRCGGLCRRGRARARVGRPGRARGGLTAGRPTAVDPAPRSRVVGVTVTPPNALVRPTRRVVGRVAHHHTCRHRAEHAVPRHGS